MTPYTFEAFFSSGKEGSLSPFLTKSSQRWAKNFPLKKAFFSLFLLLLSFSFSFFSPALGALFLSSVYFLSGTNAVLGALEDAKNLEINIDTLMMMAAFLSLFIGSGYEGALLLVLFELSFALERSVTAKANSALNDLHKIAPQKAYVDQEGSLIEKSVRDIRVGETVFVKVGEYVPLDGILLEKSSTFDLSHLTGESLPLLKKPGQSLPAGAKNQSEAVFIQVEKTSSESTLSRMIALIRKASDQKPKLQTTLDRFGKKYASCIMSTSFLIALFFPYLLSIPYLGQEGSIYRSLTFLITASPCALIIGAPTAYLAALSSCAKKGILLKGGSILDALNLCKNICFDKTGTLTSGKLSISFFKQIKGKKLPLETAISIAKGLERHVTHPIASAIDSYSDIKPLEVLNFSQILGEGLQGSVSINQEKKNVFIGKKSFIEKALGSPFTPPKDLEPSIYLLIEEALFAIGLKDPIRKEAYSLISYLQKAQNIQPVMLTGDQKKTAESVGKELKVGQVFSELSPEDKLDLVSKLSLEKGLIMVGDGMNDAPSLARATVGISLGQIGSATAIQASDVILLSDEISLIEWLLEKSSITVKIIKQNLFLAISAIVIASSFSLLGMMPLWLSVILHEGGTVIVGLNSLRLLKKTV